MSEPATTSTRPYLIRALYEWCTDNGLTPYVAVRVDDSVRVPREYVKDGEIVLNISMDATSALKLGNDCIEFKARFAGVARDIMIPMGRVMAIYARENGQGMAFPLEDEALEPSQDDAAAAVEEPAPSAVRPAPAPTSAPAPLRSGAASDEADTPEPPRPPAGGRPALKRVK